MKKLLVITIALLLWGICPARAQQSGNYVVWFTNGSSIECLSYQQAPDDLLKLVKLDGTQVFYSLSVVDRVTPASSNDVVFRPATRTATPTPVEVQPQPAVHRATPAPTVRTGKPATTAGREELYANPEYSWVRVVPRKEPFLAGLLSFAVPGLGQFYNGQIGAGFGFMATAAATFTGTGLFWGDDDNEWVAIACGVAYVGNCIWATLNASGRAKKINSSRGYAIGGGKYLDLQPSVRNTRTLAMGNTYHYGVSLNLAF